MNRLSFSQKLLLSFALLLVLVVGINSWLSESTLSKTSNVYLQEMGDTLAYAGTTDVEEWLQTRLDLLKAVAGQVTKVGDDAQARRIFMTAKEGGGFKSVYVGTTSGKMLMESTQDEAKLPAGYDPRTRSWYKQAEQTQQAGFTQPHVDASTGQVLISVVAPVTTGDYRGVVAADIPLSALDGMLKPLGIGQDGYAILVDKDGTILSAPQQDLFGKPIKTLLGTAAPLVAQTHFYGIDGKEWRVSFHPVEVAGTKWYLGLLTEQSVVDKPLITARWQVALVTLIGLALALVILYLSLRTLLQPVRMLLAALHDLASGEADLTRRLTAHTSDEFGEMAEAFNRFVERIHQSFGQVAGSTSQLAAAAEELSGTSEEVSRTVDRQQSETEQVATAMNEMSATVNEVAKNAADAARSAKEAQENTSDSAHLVEVNANNMRQLAGEIENASQIIDELRRGTESIDKVLEVINSISEQTNLLALNAAIEAARAGEHGRGFAVVADEVRTLARRTQDSTAEIQTMIESLQSGAQNAVHAIGQGRDRAHESAERASENSALLKATTEAVSRINDMNAMIASAAEEQSAVAEEINRNVANINQAGDESVQGVRQVATASDELARLAAQLQSLVGGFKI
ncbi:MAG: methyl-accepting chemotaxis protein [Acidihalobacter sp.]|uniref:methyl-accepting chemotaxis protein n=1 Tax=Acidihalobacter sp. TaxID=1872108 RepID=UPI00307F1A80